MALSGPAGLSSDSGLGGSSDGSTDVLLFGPVVDSVTEEGETTKDLHTVVSLRSLHAELVRHEAITKNKDTFACRTRRLKNNKPTV